MEKLPRGRYSKEFREKAVKLITVEKLSLPEAGRRLNLAPSTIANWVKAFKAGNLGEMGKFQKPLSDLEMGLFRTKREIGLALHKSHLQPTQLALPMFSCLAEY
jgi:transposase-like protein